MEIETLTDEELKSVPLIEAWELRRAVLSKDRQQFHGTFYGHPQIADGAHGHSSDVLKIGSSPSPRWAVCSSRVYRLGKRK